MLVLTKALGVGVITTALKAALADDSARDAAYASMAALNAKAAQAVREVENVHACTDVTLSLIHILPQSAVSARGTGMSRPARPRAVQSFSMPMAAAVV